jgi:hypothetical protein
MIVLASAGLNQAEGPALTSSLQPIFKASAEKWTAADRIPKTDPTNNAPGLSFLLKTIAGVAHWRTCSRPGKFIHD